MDGGVGGSPYDPGMPEVEVRRSARRKRTVSAYEQDGRIVVLIPAHFSKAQEQQYVDDMVARLSRKRPRGVSDEALMRRATELSAEFLDSRARPATVRWVDNMSRRWGSCTAADASIRLSHRLQGTPAWVIDYVLIHELAHLLEPNHSKAFWTWVDRYPRAERAQGFLEGLAHSST